MIWVLTAKYCTLTRLNNIPLFSPKKALRGHIACWWWGRNSNQVHVTLKPMLFPLSHTAHHVSQRFNQVSQ